MKRWMCAFILTAASPSLVVSASRHLDAARALTVHSPSLWFWFSCPHASSWRRYTGLEPLRRTAHTRWHWPRLRPSRRPSCPWQSAVPPSTSPPPSDVLSSVSRRLPTRATAVPKIVYAEHSHSLCLPFKLHTTVRLYRYNYLVKKN